MRDSERMSINELSRMVPERLSARQLAPIFTMSSPSCFTRSIPTLAALRDGTDPLLGGQRAANRSRHIVAAASLGGKP